MKHYKILKTLRILSELEPGRIEVWNFTGGRLEFGSECINSNSYFVRGQSQQSSR